MRLIDADEFMSVVLRCERLNRECPLPEEKKKDKAVNNFETGQRETFELIIEHLEKQPTVYDVDKVVEQLKERMCGETDVAMDVACAIRNVHFREAIEIVKAGGIDEQI